jgi:glycosyltransferase involved in cell wall biosynthesis
MDSHPLVSILMTAYNREKYIAEAIESVLASTYKNFELIIVDDCSKDKTVEVAKSYEAIDCRVKVYVNEKNLGDYPNRNKAASYARGKYIKYIDADDAIYYYGLQVIVEMMERFPEAGYGLDSIAQNDKKIFPYLLSPSEAYYANYIDRIGFFERAPTSCIIKRDIFTLENGFRPYRMVSDNEMWNRLSQKYPVLLMPQGLIWSRGHEESESGKWMAHLPTLYHYLLIQRHFLSSKMCPLPKEIAKKLVKIRVKGQIKIIIKLLLKLNFNEIKQVNAIEDKNFIWLLKTSVKLKSK